MNKIYKVDSLEKYEYLLNKLHELGVKWANGKYLDNEAMAKSYWCSCGGDGVCIYKRGKVVTVSDIKYFDKSIKEYGNQGEDYTFIEDVKLPKPKQIEDESTIADVTDNSQVEQPSHYIGEKGLEVREIEENFLVRYKDGHLAHLAGALLEYLLRAPSKGKLAEDIQKVKYLANEMAEYVEKDRS